MECFFKRPLTGPLCLTDRADIVLELGLIGILPSGLFSGLGLREFGNDGKLGDAKPDAVDKEFRPGVLRDFVMLMSGISCSGVPWIIESGLLNILLELRTLGFTISSTPTLEPRRLAGPDDCFPDPSE